MRDRGKGVMMEWEGFESRCRRHPLQKQGSGICPLCLVERLNKLFCSDCGELKQRHSSASSCSCSEVSTSSSSAADFLKKKSNNGSNGGGGGGSVEVGSVGRISFLIESDRPEFESSSSASAAVLLLRRSKSAAVGTTRTFSTANRAAEPVAVAARYEPPTPKTAPNTTLPAKKWYTIFFLFKKKRVKPPKAKNDIVKEDCSKDPRLSSVSSCGSDRIVVDKLVKSKSVGVGRRSFSGYFWENGLGDMKPRPTNPNLYCTPSRFKEVEVKGSHPVEEVSQPRRSSGRGWSWMFASPMRVFKHSKASKSSLATNNPPSPCSVAEMCRG